MVITASPGHAATVLWPSLFSRFPGPSNFNGASVPTGGIASGRSSSSYLERASSTIPADSVGTRPPLTARMRMLQAALKSALPVQPQSASPHTNNAWFLRCPGVVDQHAWHVSDVNGAGAGARAPD